MIKFFTLFGCLCLSSTLSAQTQEGIQTINDLGVEELIKDVFIKGSCRNVSNITAIGNETISIGQFSDGKEVIDIRDGIILSTGDIVLAEGPNNNNESSSALGTFSEDPDLSLLATDSLFDATGIEFDFVPLSPRVTFEYVFASEEYCEFVGTSFNDVFGFFVSGPGINGPFDNNAINVATLPTTNEVVSINTINHIDNANLFINNVTNIDAQNCDIGFDPRFENFIDYDGFTVPLTATFRVIPCETYHIRLIISDVGDDRLDSAVFLETNSFDLGEPIGVTAVVPGSDENIAFESCVNGQFVFTRSPLTSISQDLTIEYSISPDSEAINGVDFEEIPMSITIPAGESSYILPIEIIEDNIIEGPENLKLELVYECDCLDPTISELIITEAEDFSIDIDEISVCANQPFSIAPRTIGGVAPFDFLWETGAETETLDESVTEPTQYGVTVTDFCGSVRTDVLNIELQSVPVATLDGNFDFCETATTGIPVILEGNPPWRISYSINGIEQDTIENIQSNPFFLSTPVAGNYELTAFNDAFCDGNIVGTAIVESTFLVEADITAPTCFNSADGSIEITQLEAVAPFTVDWNIETTNDNLLENLTEGIYTITIVDADGCTYETNFELDGVSDNLIQCERIYIPNVFSPNNDGINDIFSVFVDATNEVQKIISFQIYNRWGSLMYEKNNFVPDNGITGWNGDYKGKPLDTGIYVYKINIGFRDGSTVLKSGDVTLLR